MGKHGLSRRALLSGCAALIASTVACRRSSGRKISVLYFAGLAEGKRLRANLPAFREKTGINVIFDELPYDDIRPRQLQSFKNRDADYDVVFVDDIWMYEYAHKSYIRNLSDLVKRDNYDFDDIIPKVAEAEGTLDGQIWLIPQRADVQVLFYNRVIFEDPVVQRGFKNKTRHDLRIPDTWDEYRLVAQGLNGLMLSGQRITACAETLKRPHFAFEFFATRYWSITGQDFLNASGGPLFSSPDGVKALDYLISLRDVWAPGSLNAGHDETISAFATGRVAMIPQWFAFYAILKQPQGGIGDNLGVALMPGWQAEAGFVRRAPSIGGGSLGISGNTKNVEEAWEFIKFMTSRKIMAEGALAGEIVTRRSAYENPAVFQQNPGLNVYRRSLDFSKFRPRSTAYAAIERAIGEGVSRALAREVSSKEALSDAAYEVERIQHETV